MVYQSKLHILLSCSKNCDKYFVPKKIILVHHLLKIMFDNVRKKKKRSLTKYIYFFYFVPVCSLPFLSLSNNKNNNYYYVLFYFIYSKWTNGTSKRTCFISSRVVALFPSQFPLELTT